MSTPFKTTHAIVGLFLAAAATLAGCQPEPGDVPSLGLGFGRVSHYQNYIYASGSYNQVISGNSSVSSGNAVLAIFDASDPSHPDLIDTRDVGQAQEFQVVGNKLIAIQRGYLMGQSNPDGSPATQDMSVDVYGLADPSSPSFEKSIVVPGTQAGLLGEFLAIDSETILFSVGDGVERSDAADVTFVVQFNRASGTEVTSRSARGCSTGVSLNQRVFCFAAMGKGTGVVTTFEISVSGVLSQVSSNAQAELGLLTDAVALGANLVVVTDILGVFTFDVSSGTPALVSTLPKTYQISALAGPAQTLLLADIYRIQQLDRATGAEVAALEYAGGSQLKPFNELFVAALGTKGILIFSATPTGLTKVGGYYRSWFKDRLGLFKFSEGYY